MRGLHVFEFQTNVADFTITDRFALCRAQCSGFRVGHNRSVAGLVEGA
jgi:hypothetical protein